MRRCLLPLCALALGMTPAVVRADGAPSRRPLGAVRSTGAPTIDGDLSDPIWKAAANAQGFTDRQTGLPAPDQTTALIAYDEKGIYIAFICVDRQPEGIVGRETIRDSRYQNSGGGGGGGDFGGGTEDWVEVALDPFLSFKGQDFTRFSVNPLGTRSARIAGGRASKAEWNGDWEAASKRTPEGWTAELRIPWETLNFPAGAKSTTFGINFSRFQYRTQIRSQWSYTGLQGFDDQEGRWTGVEPPRTAFKPKLSLLPYVLPRLGNGPAGERSGVDARYQLSPDFTVVASANPDFATVEGAVQNVSFSRSEQFLPEKRAFFLEGGDYFRAGSGFSLGPMFYTNRIGTFDFGAKAFGKLTPRDSVGLLATADFNHRVDVVGRYRRDLSPTDQAGIFFTQSENRDGNDHSGTLSFDGNIRRGKLGFGWQAIGSGGTGAGGRAGQLNFQFSDGNKFTSLQYLTASDDFKNPNGLIFFNDFKGFTLFHNTSIEWRKGAWRSFNVFAFPQYTWHQNGEPFQRGGGLGVEMATRSDYAFNVGANHMAFDSQLDRTLNFGVVAGATNRFRQFGFNVQTGTLGGSAYRFLGPRASVRVLKSLDLVYGAGLVKQAMARTDQHILTLNYLLSATRQIGGRFVALKEPGKSSALNGYLSYRSAGESGTEIYVLVGDPNARTFTRQLMTKFIFAV